MVFCACGCGTDLKSIDNYGRPQIFVNGHNKRKYTKEEASRWAVAKRYARNNPDKIRDNKRNYYRQRKVKAILLMGGCCHFCHIEYDGKNSPIFEFHHLDPDVKDAGITRILVNSWEVVVAELKKCVLTCANCHNLEHGGRW